jgi:uncharacterized repeat protein (TIGR02543 family)
VCTSELYPATTYFPEPCYSNEARARVITQRKAVTMATLTALTAGLSSVLLGVAPASATPFTCGLGATSLGGGICQLTYTAGTATFTPVAGTSKLEAILVGGGGDSSYGYGGGGGDVTLMNFADTATPIDFAVGNGSSPTTSTQGVTVTTANAGGNGSGGNGGTSGNGNPGWSYSQWVNNDYSGAGGGAGASPVDTQDGGAGLVVSSIAPGNSLFTGDTACYGGGGAILDYNGNYGVATCGGGYWHAVAGTPTNVNATPNSGGGAGSNSRAQVPNVYSGASGVVVVRWQAAESTVTFDMNGHGTAIHSQDVVTGTTAIKPPTPTASGLIFNGWYTDPGLTTAANFSAPITADATFYASWSGLALTGASINPVVIPGAVGALLLGGVLMLVSRRRRRHA